jgi:UDP-N-acetylmuramoyl-L-alanyl-D-glutamate--2,6-diaminopimelate ligase
MTTTMPTLATLLRQVEGARLLSGDPDTPIAGVTHSSQSVRPGELFVAIPGFKRDGRTFASEAAAAGAVAVASEPPVPEPVGVARVELAHARRALADLAAAFYGFPSEQLTLVGVTGTDGKTSTTQLIAAILEAAGQSTGWLTTVDLKLGAERRSNSHLQTTPEATVVQAFLRELVDRRTDVAVLEVSSHALELERVRGCRFDVAVFTNLSPEHLNFHGTMERYAAAKAKLFNMLAEPRRKQRPRFGVVNADDPWSAVMRQACGSPVLSFGLEQPADVRAEAVRLTPRGAGFMLLTPAGRAQVQTSLIGRFNVLNWCAAAATAHGLGIGPDAVARAAASLPPVRGRMETVDRGQPFAVIVDFAHTPQALETALRTVRQHVDGRVLLVFGNAGERDPASRPEMGRIAAELSDFFVISQDDPLFEDPAQIAAEAAAGARAAGAVEGRQFVVELDRRRAIALAIESARPGDVVLLAGKGHEPRMLVRDQRLAWDDRTVAEEVLSGRAV